ncbi:MAG: DUF5710 domain-containing protein [Acidocella sp.]|nr:DUF5710 domain-containing protein [Acidocella sp.]
MATIDERIKLLEDKLKQEKAKKQKIDARLRTAESKRKRADDTRRKILIGAVIMGKVASGEWDNDKLLALLDPALTRGDDRALFGLDSLVDLHSTQPAPVQPAVPVTGNTATTITRLSHFNFDDKDTIKALGARFEPTEKYWYVLAGQDLTPFAKWV